MNAEKKLEEWKAEEEERRLEKIAEEFLKKAAKKGKKGVGDGEAEKYVKKYRDESAVCMAKVEEAVRRACADGKRKAVKSNEMEAKRMKIWMGKRKLGESDDEDSSEDDDDEENEKSIVLNNGHHSDTNKETEGSSGSVTGGKQDRVLSGGGSCESGSEEEKDILVQQSSESGAEDVSREENDMVEPEIHVGMVMQTTSTSCLDTALVSETKAAQAEKHDCCGEFASESVEEIIGQPPIPNVLNSENEESSEKRSVDAEPSGSSDSKSAINEGAIVANTTLAELERPLSFDEFNSAAEMEVLGLERLKSELQARGLKCGGTLQERAARLFLLKSTPVEKLPKKLLAKK